MADVGVDTSIYKNVQTPNMLESMGNMANTASAITGAQRQQVELAQQKIGLMSNAAKSILALPNPTQQDAITAMQRLVSLGAISPDDFAREAANIPGDPNGDPAKGAILRKQWAAQHAMQLEAASGALQAQNGVPFQTNTGDATVTSVYNPVSRTVMPAGGGNAVINNRLGPQDRVAQQPILGPNNTPGTQSVGSKFDERGYMRPQAPQAGTGAPATMAPAGFTPTGLAPGASEAAGVTGTASGGQAAALQASADGTQGRKAILNNLEDNLKSFETGPYAETFRKLKAGANQIGSIAGVTPFDPQAVAKQEEFVKQATMLAQEQFKALGGTGTNDQLGSAFKANPNEALSKMGNEQIIQMLKGNEDAIAAKNEAWQQWRQTHGPDTYGAFAQDFNRNFEPRAFQWVYMSPQQRADLYHNMTPNEKAQLKTALSTAQQRGWIKPPGGQ